MCNAIHGFLLQNWTGQFDPSGAGNQGMAGMGSPFPGTSQEGQKVGLNFSGHSIHQATTITAHPNCVGHEETRALIQYKDVILPV